MTIIFSQGETKFGLASQKKYNHSELAYPSLDCGYTKRLTLTKAERMRKYTDKQNTFVKLRIGVNFRLATNVLGGHYKKKLGGGGQ